MDCYSRFWFIFRLGVDFTIQSQVTVTIVLVNSLTVQSTVHRFVLYPKCLSRAVPISTHWRRLDGEIHLVSY